MSRLPEPPALPTHVSANVTLRNELEVEYRSRSPDFSLPWARRARSSATRQRFSNEQEREEYFAELAEALAWVEPPPPQPHPKTYEDGLRAAGFDFVGASIMDRGGKIHGGGSQ